MNWRRKIEKEIEVKGISQRTFCKLTGVYPSELNNVIHKNRSLSIKIALALEIMEIRTAKYWLSKQLKEQIRNVKNGNISYYKQKKQ
jgi:plasmid maintenance system antidote protein VapI